MILKWVANSEALHTFGWLEHNVNKMFSSLYMPPIPSASMMVVDLCTLDAKPFLRVQML